MQGVFVAYFAGQNRRQDVAGVSSISFDRWEAGHEACAINVGLDVGAGDAADAFKSRAAEVGQDFLVVEFPVAYQRCLLGLHDGAAEG